MPDEIWTTKSGQKIPVGQLSESHAKNILRMFLRKRREAIENAILAEMDEWDSRPDNPTRIAYLRAKHGDSAVKIIHEAIAGMKGGNVYVNGQHIGWFGGI